MKNSLALFSFMLFFSSAQLATAQTNFLLTKVSLKQLPPQIQLYARVVPQRIYKISSALDGRLSSFGVNSGDSVEKTLPIANITSSTITAKIQSLHEEIFSNKEALLTARSLLKIVKGEYHQGLATQKILLQAKMKVQRAKTNLNATYIQLQSLQAQTQLHSPVNGKVLNVFASNGNYVKSGQTLLTVLPNKNRLFARAYGKEGKEIQIGQNGWFRDGLLHLLVSVKSVTPDPDVPGTWRIYLYAVNPNPQWFTGEVGTLKFINKPRSLIAVPKSALIMDQGKWWVVQKRDHHFKQTQVFPLMSNKNWVWLKRGLKTDAVIVMHGAYKIFHRNFAKNYANPD